MRILRGGAFVCLFFVFASLISTVVSADSLHVNPVTGLLDLVGSGAGTGTVTSFTVAGTAGQIAVAGTCTVTTSGTCTLSLSPIPMAAGTTHSLTGPSEYWVCTGTCTVTPPVPVAGYQFCVRNTNNVATVITLAALGSSARYENTASTAYGTAGTGTFVSGGAVGDKVCIVGLDSTHYLTYSFNGTWTAS